MENGLLLSLCFLQVRHGKSFLDRGFLDFFFLGGDFLGFFFFRKCGFWFLLRGYFFDIGCRLRAESQLALCGGKNLHDLADLHVDGIHLVEHVFLLKLGLFQIIGECGALLLGTLEFFVEAVLCFAGRENGTLRTHLLFKKVMLFRELARDFFDATREFFVLRFFGFLQGNKTLFEEFGFAVTPTSGEERFDIIQTVLLRTPEALIAFCQGMQAGAPVDSFVVPEPWDMPGYDSQVIMAAGAFVQGSSIELSADGPMKPPYAVYFQGGLTWEHAKLGVLMSLQKMVDKGLVSL